MMTVGITKEALDKLAMSDTERLELRIKEIEVRIDELNAYVKGFIANRELIADNLGNHTARLEELEKSTSDLKDNYQGLFHDGLHLEERVNELIMNYDERIMELDNIVTERDKPLSVDKLSKCCDRLDGLEKKLDLFETIGNIHFERLIRLEKNIETRFDEVEELTKRITEDDFPNHKIKTTKLTFGEALEALRDGKKVGRWQRDNIFIYLNYDGELRVHTINGIDWPWTPNQEELFSCNWRIIEDE